MIKEKINKDLKDSMLNANKTMTMTLRLVMASHGLVDEVVFDHRVRGELCLGQLAMHAFFEVLR